VTLENTGLVPVFFYLQVFGSSLFAFSHRYDMLTRMEHIKTVMNFMESG